MPLQLITANISGSVRSEMLNDQEHLVVPMTLIVPGVLNGSKGPLYYPAEELAKNPSAWNGMPMVVYHPHTNGKPTSARQPDVINTRFVGTVFNAKYQGGKLIAEGWFNLERTRHVDSRILSNLNSEIPMELSTGLTTDEDETPGEFNGVAYNSVAKNYRPDHLAILPDEEGACSLKDGCGVLINMIRNKRKSYGDIRLDLQGQVSGELFGSPDEERYVVEVFDKYFILFRKSKLWRMKYKMKSNIVTISDAKPEEVQLVTSYVSVPTENEGDSLMAKLNEKKKKEVIDNLVANCDCWDEDDREILNAMTDEKLNILSDHTEKLMNNAAVAEAARKGFEHGDVGYTFNEKTKTFEGKAKPKKKEPVTNKDESKKPKTMDEWMADAPAEIQSMVRNAKEREDQDKATCVDAITANEKNVFTEDQLNAMDLKQLEGMAALVATEEKPTVNYSGQFTPTGNKKKEENEEILPLPTINFAEKSA